MKACPRVPEGVVGAAQCVGHRHHQSTQHEGGDHRDQCRRAGRRYPPTPPRRFGSPAVIPMGQRMAKKLADAIIANQRAEINQMRGMPNQN